MYWLENLTSMLLPWGYACVCLLEELYQNNATVIICCQDFLKVVTPISYIN